MPICGLVYCGLVYCIWSYSKQSCNLSFSKSTTKPMNSGSSGKSLPQLQGYHKTTQHRLPLLTQPSSTNFSRSWYLILNCLRACSCFYCISLICWGKKYTRDKSLKIFPLTQQPQTFLPNGTEFHMRTEGWFPPQLMAGTGLTAAFFEGLRNKSLPMWLDIS